MALPNGSVSRTLLRPFSMPCCRRVVDFQHQSGTGVQHAVWARMGRLETPSYMSYLVERWTGQVGVNY